MAENISNFNLLGLYWQRNHKLLKAYFIHIFFGQRKFHHCQVKMLPLFLSLLLTYKIFWKDLIRIRKQLIQPEPVMETRCLVAGSCLVFFCYFSGFAIDRSWGGPAFWHRRVSLILQSIHYRERENEYCMSIPTNMDAADLQGFKKNQCYFVMLGIAATVKKKETWILDEFFRKTIFAICSALYLKPETKELKMLRK